MDKKKLIKIAENYFKAWSDHNLTEITSLFAEDICLHDWESNEKNLENVAKVNSEIFKNFPNISVEVINLAQFDENRIVAELKVNIEKNKSIDVVDIITFNNNYFIKAIKAYKC